MPFIGKQPQTGAYSKLDSITTSATATYNLTLDGSAYYPQSANHLLVSLNGVMQAPQDSFTVSGSQITFASALTSSDSIDFIMALGDTLDIGTPSDGTVTTGKLANSAVTATKIGSGAVEGAMVTPSGRRNVLINGNFQISQRGDYSTATNITQNTYYLDRWVAQCGNTNNGTIQDLDGSVKLTAATDYTGNLRIFQYIEDKNYQHLLGQTVTFSAYVRSNSSNARLCIYDTADSNRTNDVTGKHTGDETWQRLYMTVDFASSGITQINTQVTIDGVNGADVSISTGDYIEIKEVQLELGSVATPFEHRSYGEELRACQRYFQKQAEAGDALIFAGKAQGDTAVDYTHLLSVPLRASPTITQSGTGWRAFRPTSSFAASSATPTVVRWHPEHSFICLRISSFPSSSFTNNYAVNPGPVALSYIYFDSEL